MFSGSGKHNIKSDDLIHVNYLAPAFELFCGVQLLSGYVT